MKIKPVVTRHDADDDTDHIFAYYLDQAGVDTAVGFIDNLERAYLQISRFPKMGSELYGDKFRTPGLRHWWLDRFPFIVVYREMEHSIEIWRVLHGSMDIPAKVFDPDSL